MATSKTPKPRFARKDLDLYVQLNEERKSLKRQADELKKQADEIEERLLAFTIAHGGKQAPLRKHGWLLGVKMASDSVQWKHEFIRIQGEEAAEALIAAAKTIQTPKFFLERAA